MSKLEMVQAAVAALGDAPAADLAAFIEQQFGTKIAPAILPVLRASLREKEMLARFRQEAPGLVARALAQAAAEKAPAG